MVVAYQLRSRNVGILAQGGPRGLRANEHMKVAQQDDALAMQDSSWPGSMVTTNQPAGEPSAIAMPWIRSWTASDVHQRMAADHRSQAEQLNAEFDDACRGKSDADIQVSPLIRFGRGGWTTQSGVIVYLAPSAGTPDNVLATVRCHRAYMMMAPAGMDDCPLDLPGLELDARGDADGITLSISVKNSALIPELQRRAALELEVGKQRAAAPHQAPTESGDESGPK